MAKFNAKNLIITIFFGMLIVGVAGIVNAQQALPKGGNSLETAVKIEPGSYKGGSLDSKETEYFYIADIEFGQEIDIKATFFAANVKNGAWAILALYNEDGTLLAEEDEGFYDEPSLLTISQTYSGRDSGKYYIQTGSDLFKIASYTLEVSLTEPPAEETENGIVVGTETSDDATSTEGPNWVLILGIIAIVGIVAYFLLKKKKTSI